MKNLILSIALAVAATVASAQAPTIKVASKINKVTLFQNAFQVERTATANLSAGDNTIVVSNLPHSIDRNSIQVSGKGNFTILNVSFRNGFDEKRDMKFYDEEIDKLNKKLSPIYAKQQAVIAEDSLLHANRNIKGNNTLKVIELSEMLDFYRKRKEDVMARKLSLGEESVALRAEIAKMKKEREDILEKIEDNKWELVISTVSPTVQNAELEVKYISVEGEWSPSYSIRSEGIGKPLSIVYNASIKQESGEDWKGVELTLSTGMPSSNISKPWLHPQRVRFYVPENDHRIASFTQQNNELGLVDPSYGKAKENFAKDISSFISVVDDNMSDKEYKIGIPYDLKPDETQTISYLHREVEAIYQYYAVPKYSADTYLVARIPNWIDIINMSGGANLFLNGSYTGKTNINLRGNVEDTLSISLGKDRGILIKRSSEKSFSNRQAIGSYQRQSKEWTISVMNTKKQPINIIVEDQIPVSTDKEIEVTAIEISGATYTKESGMLTWNLDIAPSETKNLTVKYEIRYPKDRKIM